MLKDNIPVVLNYDYYDLIGRAAVDEEGNARIIISDPRIVEMVKEKKLEKLQALSLNVQPANETR